MPRPTTNLSYARSRDLIHWETSAGSPLDLPLTLQTGESVDPVPVGGGMINGNTAVGMDSQNRPIVTYHKHDLSGNTQVFRRPPRGVRLGLLRR